MCKPSCKASGCIFFELNISEFIDRAHMLAGRINADGSTPFDFCLPPHLQMPRTETVPLVDVKKEMQMISSRSFLEWIRSITNLQMYVSGAGLKCIYQTVGGD